MISSPNVIQAIGLLFSGSILCALGILGLCLVKSSLPVSSQTKQFGLGFLICFFAYILATSHVFPDKSAIGRLIIRLIDSPNLPFLWLFLLTVFVDQFKITVWHTIIGIGYSLLMIVERLVEAGLLSLSTGFSWVYFFASIAFLTHLLWVIVKGFDGDLVVDRRRSRRFVLIAVFIGTILSITLGNVSLVFDSEIPRIARLSSTLIALMVIISFWVKIETSVLEGTAPPPALPKQIPLTIKQTAILEKLRNIMERDRLFLDPTLKIGTLARQVGLGEHALRNLINKKIGYRNFPAFLNSYRIEFAKSQLIDPARSDITILEIAMNSGFNSLSAFNRSFRRHTGQTPRDYRQTFQDDR